MRKILFAAALALPLAAQASPENYTLDPYHTYPYFEIDHLGVSTVRGMFRKSSGKFSVDSAAKSGSVEINVETASIDTGDGDKGSRPRTRDEHLRTADFFNVAEFPRMTFRSTGVRFAGDNPAEIAGTLTLLGVTRPLTLKLERWVCRENPMRKRQMCGGNASGTLKRSDFGMKYGLPGVGDELKLYFAFEGYKD
ncbi:MAG: polyisoprenoid-binding protein [Burkholderiales bacterium]|nr:polyisoprenoid-binding protein [Burkholderiales bacterium]